MSFLGCQWKLWADLKEMGILVTNGILPSMLYAFTWLHAAHIILGLMALLWLAWFMFKKTDQLTDVKVINVGKFWHFLGVVWLLMHLMLFVL
jgi:cytochrome c oxidase subunit 3